MVDICDTIFSNVHMLSRTRREAGTWPIAFVNYSMLTRLWTHPDAAPQLIFSMWKRRALAYFLLFLVLVPHLYVAICILSTRSCRSVKLVAPRWVFIKATVGGELNEYNIPAPMLSLLLQDRAGNCTERLVVEKSRCVNSLC